MRVLPVCLALVSLTACDAFSSDDGFRALTGTLQDYARQITIGEATARICLDDGTIHEDWGASCAVATALSDFDGAFRVEGLDPGVYALYVEGPDGWGDHMTVLSLEDNDAAVQLDIFPDSTADVETNGLPPAPSISAVQLSFSIGEASECGSNELVIDLPSYDSLTLSGDAQACLEIENQDYVGTIAFDETFRPPHVDDCGGTWCEDWSLGTQVSRTKRRVGSLLGPLSNMDLETDAAGTWID